MQPTFASSALFLLLLLLPVTSVSAQTSAWTEVDGGRVRLVVEDSQLSAGQARGIIQIDLNPGWKTYWREPGSAGVPPQIDLTGSVNISGAEILFPAPYRFDEGDDSWTGYKKSVSLPILLALEDKNRQAELRGNIFLGICETICIPVQVPFDITLSANSSDPLSRTLVNVGFSRLPETATKDFGVTQAGRDDTHFRFDVNLPDETTKADLFLATTDAPIGMSRLEKREGKAAVFTVPISASLEKPNVRILYTLKQNDKAVSGEIVIP